MESSFYEVSRDEYTGFVSQINPAAKSVKEEENMGVKWIKTYSKTTGKLLCAREIHSEDGRELYFVFEFPPNEDRIAAKAVRKVTLNTKEEVQEFFNALSKVMKEQEEKRNAGNIC